MMLVAPTEPKELRALGTTRLTPERFGVDVLWASKGIGTIGIQRKELGDFLASVSDGRLAKEVAQMKGLDLAMLVLEGRPTWTDDGVLMSDWGQTWTKQGHRAFLWSMRQAGVWVDWSETLADTVKLVQGMVAWSRKTKHQSLMRRPGAKGTWGSPTSRESQVHLMQSFDGVGADLAGRIVDAFGGVPLAWTVDERELLQVAGLGPKKVQRMMRMVPVIRDVGGVVDVEKVS